MWYACVTIGQTQSGLFINAVGAYALFSGLIFVCLSVRHDNRDLIKVWKQITGGGGSTLSEQFRTARMHRDFSILPALLFLFLIWIPFVHI